MKRYNTPHRSRVVKTRMTEEEYAEFAERLLLPISRTEKRQSTEALCLLLLYFIVSHHRKTSMLFTGISYSFL